MGCGLSHDLNDHYPVENAFLDKHIRQELGRYFEDHSSLRQEDIRELMVGSTIEERREAREKAREIYQKYNVTAGVALRMAINEDEGFHGLKSKTVGEEEDADVDRQLLEMRRRFVRV